MVYATGGLCIFFLLVLIYSAIRIWLDGRKERNAPRVIPGEELAAELRENALRPLRQLNAYYAKRDPELADACIDETILPDDMLILGTNPGEIFHGRKWTKHLLQCDWKYWGQLTLDVDRSAFYRVGNVLYFVLPAQVRLDYWRFRIPVRITGILEEQDGLWYISKLQFINNLNSAYVLAAWIGTFALTASLLLFGLSWLSFLF
ncbi:MAG: hypothetical protein E7318_10795 [Clostridiales bacterium]|nr:hypothetical protein [Clostridiales bacterium]